MRPISSLVGEMSASPTEGGVSMIEPKSSSAPHIYNATIYDNLVDWGLQPDSVEG